LPLNYFLDTLTADRGIRPGCVVVWGMASKESDLHYLVERPSLRFPFEKKGD
jgi:hypothetical protein